MSTQQPKSNNRRRGRRRGAGGACFVCGETGHLKANCPQNNGNDGNSKPQQPRQNARPQQPRQGRGASNQQGRGASKAKAPAHHQHVALDNGQEWASRTSSTTKAALTKLSFAQLPINDGLKRAITQVMKYEHCTIVQEKSIPVALQPPDILAKAKTGTGKTLAFLIPACHKALQIPRQQRQGKVSVLVVSPTRELCQQIYEEGRILCKHVPLALQCIYGGTKMGGDLRKFQSGDPDILIATPGRLNDHLENHGLQQRVAELKVLIFDEADQMLEMGFRPAITQMLRMLPPKQTRQTMLYSATMPKDITSMADFALNRPFNTVDTVGADTDTHARVPQFCITHPLADTYEELFSVIHNAMKVPDFKVICFFVTARLTQLASELFVLMGFPVLEIHSRKSQSHRTKVSAKFRDGSKLIMFTSDVSARGLDYPDITTVVQVGLPTDKAQYVHRLGRTARAGKNGRGVLLLGDFEARKFSASIRDQNVKKLTSCRQQDPALFEQAHTRKVEALRKMSPKSMGMGYQAWLGFYNSSLRKLGWKQADLVRHATIFACQACNLAETPSLQARTVGKMGLKGVPGLRVEGRNGVPRRDDSGNGRGGRGGRGNQGNQGNRGFNNRGRGGGGGGGGGGRGRGGGNQRNGNGRNNGNWRSH